MTGQRARTRHGVAHGFATGYQPARASGQALPAGPDTPPPERPAEVAMGKLRDPRTAANLEAKASALAPRRYQPKDPAS